MSIVVTGATDALGRHVVSHLLDQGVPPGEMAAGGRNEERLAVILIRPPAGTARSTGLSRAAIGTELATGTGLGWPWKNRPSTQGSACCADQKP